MGHSYGHRMIAKEQERASVVEERSEGWQLEDRQKGSLKVNHELDKESEFNKQEQNDGLMYLRKSLD